MSAAGVKLRRIAWAVGIGRLGEGPGPLRPGDVHLFRSLRLRDWRAGGERMRFGRVVSWDGPYWHNAVGLAGAEWNGGQWLGGQSWRRHGPFVVCRYRRRGSWRSDRRWARMERKWALEQAD